MTALEHQAERLDGKAFAATVHERVAGHVTRLKADQGVTPGLAVILVAAVGRAEMIPGDGIKPGATVIDVGINRVTLDDGRAVLRGDVEFASAACRLHHLPEPEGLTP